MIRTNRIEGRLRAPVGPDSSRLSKGERDWLADWVAQQCKEQVDKAAIDARTPLIQMKRLECLLDETFAFVLNHTSSGAASGAIHRARKAIMQGIGLRLKAEREAQAELAPAAAKRRRKRAGRKPKYNAAEDARLLRLVRESSLSERMYARESGKKYRDLHLALQRARTRENYRKNQMT